MEGSHPNLRGMPLPSLSFLLVGGALIVAVGLASWDADRAHVFLSDFKDRCAPTELVCTEHQSHDHREYTNSVRGFVTLPRLLGAALGLAAGYALAPPRVRIAAAVAGAVLAFFAAAAAGQAGLRDWKLTEEGGSDLTLRTGVMMFDAAGGTFARVSASMENLAVLTLLGVPALAALMGPGPRSVRVVRSGLFVILGYLLLMHLAPAGAQTADWTFRDQHPTNGPTEPFNGELTFAMELGHPPMAWELALTSAAFASAAALALLHRRLPTARLVAVCAVVGLAGLAAVGPLSGSVVDQHLKSEDEESIESEAWVTWGPDWPSSLRLLAVAAGALLAGVIAAAASWRNPRGDPSRAPKPS